MRKTLTTAALVFALCCTAFGGEMHTPGAPVPPATSPGGIAQGNSTEPSDNPAQTADGIAYGDDTDAVTQAVLTVLLSLLP